MESIVLFFLLVPLAFGCVSRDQSVAWASRLMVGAFLLIVLSGCATLETSSKRVAGDVEAVVQTIPAAVGQVAGAAIFGGTVSVVPDPDVYLSNSVNREGRIIYNDARRIVERTVSDLFRSK